MRFGIGFIYPNYKDWDRFEAMEQGASLEEVGEMEISDAQVLREQMALADLVEPLGFDTLWSFEQHAAPYIMIPDPHQYMSYFAARTKRIDLGSMIAVLTWHNPFRVAEQVSMLQHHLRGRYYFMGVGRGLARRNFDAMNVNIDESRERFYEILDIVTLALTQEMFSFEGQFYSYKNASLRPRPLDERVITEAWGAWTSEQTLREMAARGLQPLTTPNKTLESYKEDMNLFDEIRAEHGFEPARRPILQVPLYVSEDADNEEEHHPAVHLGVRRLGPADVRARHRELRARASRTRSTGRRARTSAAALRSRRSRRSRPSSCATASSARRRSAPSASPRTGRRSTRRSSSS